MATEAKGMRVNLNGTVTDVQFKDETARNTLSQQQTAISKNTADISAINSDLTSKLNISDETFKYTNISTINNNANWACLTGIYNTSPTTIGAPDYGALVVFAVPYPTAGFNGKNWIHQLWFTNNNVVQHRLSINKTDANGWSEWKAL